MKSVYTLAIIITCLLFSSILSAEQSDPEYDGSFKTIVSPKDYIVTEFSAALTENKKLLFVLGGNWCHDSRSLAKKLDDKELSPLIKNNYRVSMIDVGYLDQAFEFTEKANMQTFYATPTVLIFDPSTAQHLNAADMHLWANAAKVSQQDTHAYFNKYAKLSPTENVQNFSTSQQQQLLRLDKFIAVQEQRIKWGYKVLGPLLERYKAKDIDDNFEAYWEQLAKLRMRLPADTKTIREQIIAATDTHLENISFPEYAAFPWEISTLDEAESASQ